MNLSLSNPGDLADPPPARTGHGAGSREPAAPLPSTYPGRTPRQEPMRSEQNNRRVGISKPVGPHTLRHAFITAALDAGVPLRDVQEAASHAYPRTTIRYDRAPAAWTGTPPTSLRPMSREHPGRNCLSSSGLRLAGPQRPGGGLAAARSASTSGAAADGEPRAIDNRLSGNQRTRLPAHHHGDESDLRARRDHSCTRLRWVECRPAKDGMLVLRGTGCPAADRS